MLDFSNPDAARWYQEKIGSLIKMGVGAIKVDFGEAAPLTGVHASGRDVYLPPGQWTDYQTGKAYGGGWHSIQAGAVPVVMLVREGAVVPHITLAQSTREMDWANLDLVVYATAAAIMIRGSRRLAVAFTPDALGCESLSSTRSCNSTRTSSMC